MVQTETRTMDNAQRRKGPSPTGTAPLPEEAGLTRRGGRTFTTKFIMVLTGTALALTLLLLHLLLYRRFAGGDRFGGGKHRGPVGEDCYRKDIFDVIPVEGFEPSDASWDASSKTLYVIDDNGRLAAIPQKYILDEQEQGQGQGQSKMRTGSSVGEKTSVNDESDVKIWNVVSDLDLEGCAVDHDHPEIVYLGAESPAEFIAFNVTSGQIQARFPVQANFDAYPLAELKKRGDDDHDHEATNSEGGVSPDKKKHKKKKNKKKKKKIPSGGGLEALAFVRRPGKPGLLLAGRQEDAKVFIYRLSEDRASIKFLGASQTPGPGEDLSAITAFAGRLFFVFDREYIAVSTPLLPFLETPELLENGEFEPKQVENYLNSLTKFGESEVFRFDERGQEGIAFAYDTFECAYASSVDACGDLNSTPVVYAIDPPRKGTYRKKIQVGDYGRMRKCWLDN